MHDLARHVHEKRPPTANVLRCLRILVDARADVNAEVPFLVYHVTFVQDAFGTTPLMYAARYHAGVSVVRLLVDSQANVDAEVHFVSFSHDIDIGAG